MIAALLLRLRLFNGVHCIRRQCERDRQRLVLAYSPQLAIVAGIAIILHGPAFSRADARPSMLMREKRATMAKPVGLWGAYVMGLAFAFGWTPCIRPILAAILAVAASRETVGQGAGLLASPFLPGSAFRS